MDPQVQSALTPEVDGPERVINEGEPRVERDNHGITIVSMAIFVLLSLAAVAFLYYQNQQLKTMLASYQQVQTTPIPAATTTLKNYTNTKYKFSFSYPGDWGLEESDNKDLVTASTSDGSYRFIVDMRNEGKITRPISLWAQKQEKANQTATGPGMFVSVISDNAILIAGEKPVVVSSGNEGADSLSYLLDKDNNIYEISLTLLTGGDKQVLDQILSTFKFISPTTSPSAKPVACTLEAKICPDGSSVGRTGPNCEFAPCPTP